MFRLWGIPPFTLPSFANLALPANIQRRFLSFLLKRTLGHLVKPGQLDINQIETQMGNGWVEIKDIELDQGSINELLKDLPLQLQEGSIGTITARIPLPNIFTAPFSLSLASLHLTFKLRKTRTAAVVPAVNLAESVTSVAESFVHDELSPRETRNLRDSILHAGESEIDEDDLRLPPGSIDPYLEDEIRNKAKVDDETEIEGASIFATLVARLLARFSFTATDTIITIVHEHVAEYTLKIPQIHFSTEDNPENTLSEIRTVRVSGLTLTTTNPQQMHSSQQLYSASTPPDPFEPPTDHSSSDDEDPTGMMQSAASSMMYHSAASIVPGSQPSSPIQQMSPVRGTQSPHVETLISLSEPVVIRAISTRASTSESPQQGPSTLPSSQAPSPTPRGKEETRKPPRLSVSIEAGTIAIAIRSRHIQALSATGQLVASMSSPSTSQSDVSASQGQTESPEIHCRVRGIVAMIILDESCPSHVPETFLTRPLSQPLETRHLRLQLEKIELSLVQASLNPTNISANLRAQQSHRANSQTRQLARVAVSEVVLFSVSPSAGEGNWFASPILIHDPNLPHQYTTDLQSFPTFEVDDWRRGSSINFRPSQWRSRIPQTSRRRIPVVSDVNTPFLVIRKEMGSSTGVDILECELEPIHIFLDLELVANLLPFIEASTASVYPDDSDYELKDAIQDAAGEGVWENTPRAGFVGREKVEGLREKSSSSTNIVVVCSMIRIQIRVPPPPLPRIDNTLNGRAAPRSGSMTIDLQTLRLVLGDPDSLTQPKRHSTRFATGATSGKLEGKILVQVEWKRVLLALAGVDEPRASGFISVSPFETPSSDAMYGTSGPDIPLLPRILVRSIKPKKSNAAVSQSSSVECQIPVVQVFLSKPAIDGIQLWADDCAQWAERTLGEPQRSPSGTATADTSLIGSQYFAQRQHSLSSFGTDSTTRAYKPVTAPARPSEIAILIGLSEIGIGQPCR
ncbi:autophagy- protein 2 [Tulasnella sp. 419]|nr:autophagy- protein 2 [Tulasnella sp. 419]